MGLGDARGRATRRGYSPDVRHAGLETLAELEGVLGDLRRTAGIVERRPGVFYRGSKAFLHFHEDPTGPYADVRLEAAGDFERFRVRTATERRQLLTRVRTALRG
jgi:hypothetical protein